MKLPLFFDQQYGTSFEALIPSEAVILAHGLDLRNHGVRPASSVRAANLLVVTDNENMAGFQASLSILLEQMSQPAYVLFVSSDDKKWLGMLPPDARLQVGLLSSVKVSEALVQLSRARQDPHAGHDMSAEADNPHAGHDMSAMTDDPHAGHDMSAMNAADPHAGHDMSTMNINSGHAGHDMGSFMSMVAMTDGQPRSPDGLVMESDEVVFGPFHPALEPGWQLKLLLDGDTVESATVSHLELTTKQPPAPRTYDILAWLLRFGEVLGWQSFTNSVRRTLLLSANSDQESLYMESITKLTHHVHRNRLVRARLNGLGSFNDQDAWFRLLSVVDGLMTDSLVLPRLSSTQTVLPKLLVGLELGDALLVTASFYVEAND